MLSRSQEAAIGPGTRKIIAGAGSGKTTVLVEAIRRAVEQGAAPEQMLAVTFTRRAGDSLRAKLADVGVEKVWAGTIHSWCYLTLRRWGDRFTVVDEDDLHDIVLMVAQHRGLGWADKPMKSHVEAIVRLSAYLPLKGRPVTLDAKEQLIVQWTKAFLQSKRLVYIEHVLGRWLHKATSDAGFLAWCSAMARTIAWDEFQDSSPEELEIYKRLAPDRSIVIGDVRQAIYGFRGGSATNLTTLPADAVASLSESWRCPRPVLEVANQVARTDYPAMEPATCRPDDAIPVHWIPWPEEIRGTDPRIMNAYANFARAYSGATILCRTNRSVDAVVDMLRMIAPDLVVASLSPRTDRYAQGLWRCVSYMVRYALDPTCDWVAWRCHRFMVDPDFGSRPVAYDGAEVRTEANKGGNSYTDVLRARGELPPLMDRLCEMGKQAAGNLPMSLLLNEMPMCKQLLIDPAADMRLSEYAAWFARRDLQDQFEEAGKGVVCVMTAHASKGLEFPAVIVHGAGVEFPLPFAKEEGEDERNVLYVAVTRAKRALAIGGRSGPILAFPEEPKPQNTEGDIA